MARILIVDDEEGLRDFMADTLELEDHQVDQARDGEAAWDLLLKRSYHLVLTDLKMPGLSGLELLRRVKDAQPETEVIVLTAHGSVDSAVEAMKLGAFDYLRKPLDSPTELRMIVGRALEHRGLRAIQEAAQDNVTEPPLSYGAPVMRPVIAALEKVSATDATVLLVGESGTGKEVAARSIHRWSRRAAGPFVAVNCAALSEQLLESELFGHEKGAFTGAHARRRGRIELAQGGTFFLDEVGELAPQLQAKLLRVLQERSFERVGGGQTVRADVRWVAATNRDLPAMIRDGRFREDLFHRLAVFPVRLPPLRRRPEDLIPLSRALLVRIGASLGRPGLVLSENAAQVIASASWPGNVRELANALERAAILADGRTIRADDLVLGSVGMATPVPPPTGPGDHVLSMAEAEKEAIRRALEHYDGNRRKAAEHLGIGLRTLYDKLKRYDLT
ncbi:MAG: sigma-54-dependent Fis family transcriptional regulator [Alphaproteobacteria bacterium]|nr:sigma-54-dependent Fis family transcriptional regulator [Alphaproteobacteria bacterium]